MDFSRLQTTPFGDERIRRLSAVVVGAGALGNEVAKTLGLLGFAAVTVVDPDTVEAGNLPRSFFFCPDSRSVGRNKAEALTDGVRAVFPATSWAALPVEIADVGLQRIHNAQLLFSCVDSDLARLEIAYLATKLDLPVVDGGLGTQDVSCGRVTYFPGRHAACYGCLLSPSRRGELLALWSANAHPCWTERELQVRAFPSTPTMAAIVAAMQVEIGLRAFLQAKNSEACFTTEIEFGAVPRLTQFKTDMSATCPFHHAEDSMLVAAHGRIADILQDAGADALQLVWPICTSAKCRQCRFEWAPMERIALFRKAVKCPACSSREVWEQETIRSIDLRSPYADLTAQQLGLPADDLIAVNVPVGVS
jgi:adenylyltransferase/sulfurtransferase